MSRIRLDDITAMINTVEGWRESARKSFKEARENLVSLSELGDEGGVQHFREECTYLNGRIDSYGDVLLELREKRLGI